VCVCMVIDLRSCMCFFCIVCVIVVLLVLVFVGLFVLLMV